VTRTLSTRTFYFAITFAVIIFFVRLLDAIIEEPIG
jgi:hypothetical protein